MAWTKDSNGDNLKNIKNMLQEDWNTGNVAKPIIALARDKSRPTKRDLLQNDKVFLYQSSQTKAPADIGYIGEKREQRISIDIRTMRSGERLHKVRNEVNRVMLANRKNPTDSNSDYLPFRIIKPVTETDLSDGDKGFYRIVYDIMLITPYEAIST